MLKIPTGERQLQAWLRSWTRVFRETLQLVVRARLELGNSGFQVPLPPPNMQNIVTEVCLNVLKGINNRSL